MFRTELVGLIWPRSPEVAVSEANAILKAGADSVMIDLRQWTEERRATNDFRSVISQVNAPCMFCLYDGAAEVRTAQLLRAAEAGATYVDIEGAGMSAAKAYGAKVILSEHRWNEFVSFEATQNLFRNQIELGADVVKLVTRIETEGEWKEAKRITEWLRDNFRHPWIYLGCGKYGHEQRFFGAKNGCAMTFAPLNPLPGGVQPVLKEFLD